MTPQQLYKNIEPVLMAFRLSGMDIDDIIIGDNDEETGISFIVYKEYGEICFVLHPPKLKSEKYVSICSPYQNKAWIKRHISKVPRFIAREFGKIL